MTLNCFPTVINISEKKLKRPKGLNSYQTNTNGVIVLMLDAVDVFITPLRDVARLLNATILSQNNRFPYSKVLSFGTNRTESLLIATRIVFIV